MNKGGPGDPGNISREKKKIFMSPEGFPKGGKKKKCRRGPRNFPREDLNGPRSFYSGLLYCGRVWDS